MKEKDNNGLENNPDMDINTDENLSGLTHLNEPVSDNSELEKIKTELEEAKDKYLRSIAELDNFKRRNAKERLELIQTAGREIITDLLDILDDCDRAQNQMENSDSAKDNREGALLVFNKLRNILQARGLKVMKSINEEFDPELHDAITEIAAPSKDLRGKVVDEIAKGYYLNDKIIRHAKVVVGK
ncbi:MAG: nucleotide exchange factor GrpE [Bacteroidetes bacterium]|nr:nucleotide exchange factor GrpE [Bacteroidota bacterium]MBS1633489.1 nucleotide exchange factor GrpE [Bacteroidota bacterium]